MRLAAAAVFAFVVALFTAPARADEVAPGLARRDLETFADDEVRAMAKLDGRGLVGLYAAIDPDATDPRAQAACDDDGDPVVVFTTAMLQLAASLATASLADETRVAEYAAFTARTQARSARWLPLPARPGAPAAPSEQRAWERRVRGILAFVAAREIERLRAGDLVCPRPTATRERGDAVWTADEARTAAAVARRLYPDAKDDADAFRRLAARHDDEGARALLAFFAEHARVRASEGARFVPTYAVTHPNVSAPARE